MLATSSPAGPLASVSQVVASGDLGSAVPPAGRFLLATTETVAQTPRYGLQVIDLSTGRVITVPTSPSASLYGVTW